MSKKTLTAVSLFSGCGGFDWGAKQAGVKIIWANDHDSAAAAAYRSLFPEVEFHQGDVRKVVEFPKADILIGCYPCTGFSEGAKRRAVGMEEKRDLKANDGNFLYREFLRALRQVQPKFLFVENVRGMLSASNGWFLERQLESFRKNGYKMKLQMLTASNYGVPQERKRVFLVGVHKSVIDFEYNFPEPTHGPDKKHPWVTLRNALSTMVKASDDDYLRRRFHGHYLTRNRKRGWDDLSFTIVAHGSHVPLHPEGEPMVHVGPDQYELRGSVNRRLTWRECARIQALPQHIDVPGSIMAKYRVVGNAVPPPLAEALIIPVVQYLKSSKAKSRS